METIFIQLSFLVNILNLLGKKFTFRLQTVKDDHLYINLSASELMELALKGVFNLTSFTKQLKHAYNVNYVELFFVSYKDNSAGYYIVKFDDEYHFLNQKIEFSDKMFRITTFQTDYCTGEIYGDYLSHGFFLKIATNWLFIPTPKFAIVHYDYQGECTNVHEFFCLKKAKKQFRMIKGRSYKALTSRKNKARLSEFSGKTIASKWYN